MAPPTYGDLGKASRDVFGKGYHFSLVKLDVKTKTASGKLMIKLRRMAWITTIKRRKYGGFHVYFYHQCAVHF